MRLIVYSILAASIAAAVSTGNTAFAETSQEPVQGVVLDEISLDADGEQSAGNEEVAASPAEETTFPSQNQAVQPIGLQATPNQLAPLSKQLMINTTKLAMPLEQVGNSMTVISRSQIEQRQTTSLIEVLRNVPGLDISQSGSFGSTSSIFMRGLNSEHTLVMIDGVRLNDPISPGRSFNFIDQISPDAVERIEVMRGPQGPLYGSDGMGGVINIITRRGEGKPTLYGKISGGSFGTLQQDYGASGHLGEKLRSFVHVTRQDMRGFSSAGSRYGYRERDGYHNTALMGRVEYTPFRQLTLDVTSNYSKARFDLDNSFGNWDDPNYTGTNRIFTLSGGSRLKLLNDKFEQIARVSFTDSRRTNRNDVDVNHPFDAELSRYTGKLFTVDVQNNFYLHPTNTLTAGVNLQHEWGHTDRHDSYLGFDPNTFNMVPTTSYSNFSSRSNTNMAFYAQDHIQLWNRWFTTLGIRRDNHNRFGGYTTYRAATSFVIRETGTTLKASYGTGFKAPTIYQLFSQYGNPDLKPETSIGWDAGVEQAIFHNRLQMGTTVFQNHVKNLIQFPISQYENVSKARTQGMEAYLASQPFRNMELRASYTYTDTKDLSVGGVDSGDPLLRRPRNKFSINMNYKPHEKVNINLDITHMGQRSDKDFNPFPLVQVKLAAFTLVNLAVSYDVTRNINIFGKLMNLLDTPYETVKGYGMPRISAYGGVRLAI